MHLAAHYLEGLFPAKVNRTVVESHVLTPVDAAAVSAALPVDANDYYYSCCVSLIEGLGAIDAGFHTWSTVKMYYSVFYALRAMLAWDNVAVFWPHDAAPFRVDGAAGASPRWIAGKGSHRAMLNCFRQLRPTHQLLQAVGNHSDGLAWLLKKREEANYSSPRFSEPEVPPHYSEIDRLGVRQAIAAYLDPINSQLAFDEDHSIVSFPLAVLQRTADSAISHGGAMMDANELAFLTRKCCRERRSELAPLMSFIRKSLS